MTNDWQSRPVSVFANAYAKRPRNATLGEVLTDIRGGRYAEPVARLRALLRTDPNAYDLLKKKLPAFTISGACSDRKTPLEHSGLIQIDVDGVADQLPDLRQRISADPHVAFSFVSPSGAGLKLGVAIDGTRHADSFLAAQSHFEDRYKILVDPSVKDPLRLCFVSHDPELWTNPEPRILTFTELSDAVRERDLGVLHLENSTKSGAVYSVKSISDAVALSLPSHRRSNNICLFRLARALLSLELVTPVSPVIRLQAFALWYERTRELGFIRHTREHYMQEFMTSVKNAKTPLRESPVDTAWKKIAAGQIPPEALMFDEAVPRQIFALCVELDRASQDPWFLPSRKVARLVGQSHTSCAAWIAGFVALKLLVMVEPGTAHRSPRYRCVITKQEAA